MLAVVADQHNAEWCLHTHAAMGVQSTAPGDAQLHPTARPHAHSHNTHLPWASPPRARAGRHSFSPPAQTHLQTARGA